MSLGYLWQWEDAPADEAREITAGLAVRHAGELNGVAVQNGLHEVINDHLVYLPYDDVDQTDAAAFTTINYHRRLGESRRWGCGYPGKS